MLPLAHHASGEAGKPGGGDGGQVPQYWLAFPPAAPCLPAGRELVPGPQKAPEGAEAHLEQARCPCQGARTLVARPLPSASQAFPHSSSRLSASARTFGPSWAGTPEAPRRPRGKNWAEVRLREDTGEVRIWRILPGLRDTPVLKWVLLPLSVCASVCGCVCRRVRAHGHACGCICRE